MQDDVHPRLLQTEEPRSWSMRLRSSGVWALGRYRLGRDRDLVPVDHSWIGALVPRIHVSAGYAAPKTLEPTCQGEVQPRFLHPRRPEDAEQPRRLSHRTSEALLMPPYLPPCAVHGRRPWLHPSLKDLGQTRQRHQTPSLGLHEGDWQHTSDRAKSTDIIIQLCNQSLLHSL